MEESPKPRGRVSIQGLAPARKPTEDAPAPQFTSTSPFRIGHGYDIHRLQTGGRLLVGGVMVSDQCSAVAHSDGDVLIHALVDAILGAMGWGDIGQLFPNSDPNLKGAASRIFLQIVADRLRDAHCHVVNADMTVLAESPKLAPFKDLIIQTLREILGPSTQINVKAGTNEGCDAIGKGAAIACHAVVLLAADA